MLLIYDALLGGLLIYAALLGGLLILLVGWFLYTVAYEFNSLFIVAVALGTGLFPIWKMR